MECALKPLHDVEIIVAVQRNGILVEQIRHEHEVAVGGELVGNQLSVEETVTDDIGYAVMVRLRGQSLEIDGAYFFFWEEN